MERHSTEPQPRRQVTEQSITYVGLYVHKNSINIAVADEGRDNEVRYYGTINGGFNSLDKIVRELVLRGHPRTSGAGIYKIKTG